MMEMWGEESFGEDNEESDGDVRRGKHWREQWGPMMEMWGEENFGEDNEEFDDDGHVSSLSKEEL